jgi:adenosylcobinamide-phosphate synthase
LVKISDVNKINSDIWSKVIAGSLSLCYYLAMLTFVFTPSQSLLILLLAVVFDTFIGEPPTQIHPVVWLGRLVELWKRFAPARNPIFQLFYGLVAVLISAGLILYAVHSLLWLAGSLSEWVAVIVAAYLLKGCFSIRMLGQEGLKIRRLLNRNDLPAARYAMRSLVSRDTSSLSEDEICGAAIESVAENTTDSVVSPLLFYMILGVPGALCYRLLNTFDSMIGYRGKYEYLGKAAARLDDILNWLPARLTAWLLVANAPLYGGNRTNARRILRRDRTRTASPNAGWTMAAIAGALEIRLTKRGHYALGDDLRPIYPDLILATVKALYLVSFELIFCYLLLILVV